MAAGWSVLDALNKNSKARHVPTMASMSLHWPRNLYQENSDKDFLKHKSETSENST